MNAALRAAALIAALTAAAAAHAQTPLPAAAEGAWIITSEGRRGPAQSGLLIERTAAGHVGTMQREGRDALTLQNVQAHGDGLSFKVTLRVMGMSIDLAYRGTVSGDSISGLIETPRGERPFTGTRAASADAGSADAGSG